MSSADESAYLVSKMYILINITARTGRRCMKSKSNRQINKLLNWIFRSEIKTMNFKL